METLIELIVWIFKAIFGDSKSADMTHRTPPSRTPPRRGPYNYGDESGSRRPKTLEEILEEVRREAAQKKGGGAARSASQAASAAASAAAASAAAAAAAASGGTRTLRAPLESERSLSEPLSTISPEPGRAALGRLESSPTLATLPQMSRQAPQPGAPAYKPPMPELISPQEAAATLAASAANPQAISTVREMHAYLTQQPAAVSNPALAFVRTLRNANPQARREAAWQAVVLAEIFGPPRSRRMGSRLI